MKRAALILAALAAILTAAAAPVRTATENFVTNKIAAAVASIPAPDYSTNNDALVETIQAKAPAPDFTTGNETLVATIAATATNLMDASKITDGTNTIDAARNAWGGEYAPWVLDGLTYVWNSSVHAWTNENWYIEYNARYKYLAYYDSAYGLIADAQPVEENALSAELVYVEGAGEGVLGIATRESVYKFLGKLALATEIPQVVVPSTNAVKGAAADAKATGTALYTGFTPWVLDFSVHLVWTGTGWEPRDENDVAWGIPKGSLDSTSLSWTLGVDAANDITATRRLITPTKTSQLTNDGSNGVPFVAETQLAEAAVAATNYANAALFSKTGGVIAASNGGRTSVRINGSLMQGCTTVKSVGPCSHAEGTNTTACAEHSHAEGRETRVESNAPFSHAEGYGTRAGLDTAVGIGARGSHAEGWRTRANGRGSHSDGTFSVASNDVSYVWSGDTNRLSEATWYGSHGDGTFSINPIDGIYGFYIGDYSLGDLMPDTSSFARRGELDAVSGTVGMWESYWDGTNVMFEVTNYYGNTSGEFPRLRIKENRDGVWTNVWDEATKFEVCERQILARVSESNAAVLAEAREVFAPRAWGAYSDKGTTNVLPNTTFMANPETYFGGGTEYQRVAVGSGAVCVLVDKGALVKTAGEPGTFRFQDDGGTNYFGFSKSDSYTVGCNTDGITVEGNLVTLRYDVIMGGEEVPIVYWRLALDSGAWVQLNNSDGTAADGAPYTVTWYTSGGSYYAAINCGSNGSGFFKAETSVMGDVVFETNMKVSLGGGIVCTNTASGTVGVIRPAYNGSTVTWTWSAR